MGTESPKSFQQAVEQKPVGLWREILGMLKQNKKYWMIPMIVILALFAALVILGATSAAPFIYTLF
jgi:hypothetical protein